MIVESLVAIEVKVVDHLLKVFRLQLTEAILSLEICQRLRIDEASVLAINSLERCVRLKVSHCRQNLPDLLYRYLLLCMVDEDLLQS